METSIRDKLMGARIRYLQSAIRNLRNLISTHELFTNRVLIQELHTVEENLKKMEEQYASPKPQ